jgi:WD40 repeat protein
MAFDPDGRFVFLRFSRSHLVPGTDNDRTDVTSSRYMATAGNDAIINLWQTDDWIGIHSFDDPMYVALSSFTRCVDFELIPAADWEAIQTSSLPYSGETKHLAFSDDGEMLAVAGDESLVYIVRLPLSFSCLSLRIWC